MKWENFLKDKNYQNWQEMECLNSPKSNFKIIFLIKYPLPEKTSGPGFSGKVGQTLKE